MITEKTGVIAPIPENIPEELTERRQWVLWRNEERGEAGERTKVPYTAAGGKASSADRSTWTTFGEVLAAYERRDFDGVGFVFSSADPFVGIDLDDCRDQETGEIAPWAQKIINRARGGYVESSPSGMGVHIIVKATVRKGRTRRDVLESEKYAGRVEMYGRAKFFTVTGRIL